MNSMAEVKIGTLQTAFTLIELLGVIAIVAVLAALLLPALSRAKAQGQKAQCINNFRQLHLAAQLYGNDHGDQLPRNHLQGDYYGPGENWVGGAMSWDSHPDNTNTFLLTGEGTGRLGQYLNNPTVFKCPSDQSWVEIEGKRHNRVRSVSMNMRVGDGRPLFLDRRAHQYVKWSSFHRPTDTFLFVEEHEDSIFAGAFAITPPESAEYGFWGLPASRHRGAGTLSFADGSVEVHKWLDPRTVKPVDRVTPFNGFPMNSNPDAIWIVAHGLVERTY
jgi:prepilin-type N-terminal cleavage/methylation domain-containing protein/prepilin-type processing-associated H-X9-DG protein